LAREANAATAAVPTDNLRKSRRCIPHSRPHVAVIIHLAQMMVRLIGGVETREKIAMRALRPVPRARLIFQAVERMKMEFFCTRM
jgi:hypothetical protein